MAESVRANSIAIIGMAGRFPGANCIEQYWSNIVGGVESIAEFSDEELLRSGASRELIGRPDFVKAAPVLDDVEHFDAGFFKISRREAEMMDPQQRIMLELAWETLERAGYAGDAYRGLIGVFSGAGGLMSSYLCSPFHVHGKLIGPTGSMQCIGNDKDYLSTRVSYKLDLRGPSLTVQSACSTSLVAVHLACQSLLAGDCDMALAGGVTIRVPHRMGYLHSSQALLSPDGHCRPFDAKAEGTIFGSGAGLVLLKPLAQALDDGDHIHAVIRGSAINNDGAAKLSYWATNAEGQMAACADALAVAETPARSIGYLEAHGTATAMGDPVEIFGLTRAYRRSTQDKQFCAIGSVKSNFGHLEAAAGIAGLIKAALVLEHKTLPPSLHYHQPNRAIHFTETPFYVNTECRSWAADGKPRRAAVNSLGIGGTNAHVILEETPESGDVDRDDVASGTDSMPAPRTRLLTLSAKSANALRELCERYAEYFAKPEAAFGDVCFTTNVGRGQFPHRLAVVADSAAEARDSLQAWLADKMAPAAEHGVVEPVDGRAVFLFSGDASNSGDAGQQLYDAQPVFREAVDRCRAVSGQDRAKPLVEMFALQYGLAELWTSWGVVPAAVLGKDAGEYAAACVAGILTLEEAVRLAVADGQEPAAVAKFREACAKAESPKAKVRFLSGDLAACVAELDAQGFRIFVEIGPRPQLLGPGKAAMKDHAGLWLPSLEPGKPEWRTLLSGVARLYVYGAKIDFGGVSRGTGGRRVVLPTYPFQRQRYWIDAMAVIKQDVSGQVRVLAIEPAQLVDAAVIEQCYREIAAALDGSEETCVLVDFSRVNFMSSMALGMLVRINKKCKEYKVGLRLSGITPDILQVFKITGMDKIFDIHATAAEAVAAFQAAGSSLRRTGPKSYEVT
ncbi:MAG: acyltransferase domain-containing protein [Planctomycetaceae bacterium]|nr:acyltransferase domain-containing protein [Planctomycetaceae bacterium]